MTQKIGVELRTIKKCSINRTWLIEWLDIVACQVDRST